MIFPAGIFAQVNKDIVHSKFQDELTEKFKEDNFAKYIVVLDEQTDTMQVALNAERKAMRQNLSEAEVKKARQNKVVSQLQKHAEVTQKDVINLLKKEKTAGRIKEYHSYYIINAIAVTGNKASAERIASLPEVESVILDQKQKLIKPEIDESIATYEKSDSEVEWNIERIGVPDIWKEGINGEGTVIANIDSGVDGLHPALREKYRGYNPDDPDNPNHEFNWHDAVMDRKSPMDSDGHGTHTMGTMVGEEPDGSNKVGAAPGAKWIAVRAFWGDEGYDSDILEAGEWILAPTDANGVPHPEKAPDVVNNSWGGNPINNDWFRPMVRAWRSVGIVPIFSIGNAGLFTSANPGSASAPGNYPESISVGATDQEDKLASFSLRGPSESGHMKPDISAPGVAIRSSIPGETWNQFDYTTYSGTSMAAPLVAATVLLMKQADPTLTVDQIDDVLKQTATAKTNDTYPESPNNGYGYGLLNAKAAVQAVQKGIGSVEGQVVTNGMDDQNPIFDHAKRQTVFKGEDAQFSIHAADNISVDNVILNVQYDNKKEKTYRASRVDGDYIEGVYETVIPADDIVGDKLEYWWTINDFYGNQTRSDKHVVQIKEGIKAGYVQDFESYPDGWYSFGRNNSWEWGIPQYGPEKAASGKNVMGTDLRGQYEINSDMSLVMPPILVEKGTLLRFKQWYSLSWFGEDTGTIYASEDGENWQQLYQVVKTNENWHEVGIDLSSYAGKKIYIMFSLTSRDNRFPGWYIDDVKLVNNGTSSEGRQKGSSKKEFLQASKSNVSYPVASFPTSTTGKLPINATVQVEETGWKTNTNPQNGKFTIYHEPGEYTLKINAYGYKEETKKVKLNSHGFTTPKISLEALPKQTITGKVTDAFGNAIKDATVMILEDHHVKPVKSNIDGTFSLDVYEGEYTVKVNANRYLGQNKQVAVKAGETLDLEFSLQSFFLSDGSEIKYDNGKYGKNLVMGKKGNGFAVRMSLDEGKTSAMLTGAKLQFWADHIPVPGGDDIELVIYDATGKNGSPGNKLAGPIRAKAKRDLSQWTEVDLSGLGLVVEDDFYILYIQSENYPYIPGFVSDGDSKNWTGRSWDYFGGNWYQTDKSYGNYMIRAIVDYGEDAPEMIKPVITSPKQGIITNQSEILIEGTATSSVKLGLKNNGKEVGVAETDQNGNFSIKTSMQEGKNEYTVTSLYSGSPVNASDSVTVTLDTVKPELVIDNPKDGSKTNQEKVLVEGSVKDANLEIVKINDKEVSVKNSRFSKQISLKKGENKINVTSLDRAGNKTTQTVKIYYGQEEPKIDNIQPATDQYLLPGEELDISFTSNVVNGKANYEIKFPKAKTSELFTSDITMEELEPGVYKGTWIVPENTAIQGAIVQVEIQDGEGNRQTEEAKGRLFIASTDLERIAGDIRYDTAVEISKKGWAKADTVILARGDHFADALSGAPLSYKLNSPILLTPSKELWKEAEKEIKRLDAKNVIILGGEQAISNTIKRQLEKSDLNVRRINGKTRFETSALIAKEVSPNGNNKIVIANGMDFPDALSAASHAAKEGLPILLTKSDRLPDITIDSIRELGALQAIVIGGPNVIEDSVFKRLPEAKRLGGNDRYETNIMIAKHFGVTRKHMYVATGKEYADTLTGAALAAKTDSTILLVHAEVPKVVKEYLESNDVKFLSVFGGDKAVNKQVMNKLKEIIQ